MSTAEAATIESVQYSGTAALNTHSWNDPAAWVGNVVPGSGDVARILNAVIVLSADATVGAVKVESSGYLYLYNVNDVGELKISGGPTQYSGDGLGKTLTIENYLESYTEFGIKAGANSTKGSTIIFTSTTANSGSGYETIRGSQDVTLWNVEVPTGAVLDFNSGAIGGATSNLIINNELRMQGGSVITNAPFYGSASSLVYQATSNTPGAEWTHSASSGKGVPYDVEVGTSATLTMSSANNYTCRQDLLVDAAGASLDLSAMTGNLIVDRHVSVGAGLSSPDVATLTFTSTEGKGDLLVDDNLTISAQGVISGTQGDLEVGGNFTHDGTGATFNYVKFDGAGFQEYSGAASSVGTAMVVDSLVVANSRDNASLADSDMTFTSNVDITAGGVFNPVDGSVDINGTFTMNSDANGTARIATLSNSAAVSDVDGNITFERFIPSTSGVTWLAAGNYVIGATLGDWQTSLSSDYLITFQWDETHVLNNSQSSNGASWWSTVTGSGTVLEDSDYGYYVLTMAGPGGGRTLTATGGYNKSQVDLNLTLSAGAYANGGWHLLTNPFPSQIDGSAFLADNSSRVSAYQIYDNDNDVFVVSGASGPGTIDVGQSFWVQVGSAGAVSFELDQITHDANSFVRNDDELEEALVGVRIEQEDGRYGTTYLRFHENGLPEYQWDLDVTLKHSGSSANPEIYTRIEENNHELVINSLGSLAEIESIPLIVESGSMNVISLMLDENFPLPDGVCMRIEDTETGAVAGLGGDPLVVEVEPYTTYENRFVVSILNAPIFESTASHCEGGVVHFNGDDADQWVVSWSDVSGDLDGSGCVSGLEAGEYIFEATNPINQCHTQSDISINAVCMGDFNMNGERDITDLLILLVGIQPVNNFEGSFPETDCDCDGAMTTLDLLMFLPTFGGACE